jgi:dTDP-4-dehydrorhamnose reductase
MKVLIFGGTGMLGHKLVQVLGRRFEVFATIRATFDDVERYGIFDRSRTVENIDVLSDDAVAAAIRSVSPDVVVNAVGVIKQLPEAKDEVTALGINTMFPLKLARLANDEGFRLISISTDCVFTGSKGNYTEDDAPDARDLYGLSKLLGEVAAGNCLALRTSMIGRELNSKHSLVEWFLSNRGERVDGWTKAIYSGFTTNELARIVENVIESLPDLRGLYHVSSEPVAKFELLRLLNSTFDTGVEIVPSDQVVIDRSLNSTRFREATGYTPPSWPEMVAQMAADPTPYDAFHADAR